MGKGRGGQPGGQLALTTVSEDPEKTLRHQQQTGPFYGPRHLWQRVEFWGRGRASGQKHRVMQGQALGGWLPG